MMKQLKKGMVLLFAIVFAFTACSKQSGGGTATRTTEFDHKETVYLFSGMSTVPSTWNPLDPNLSWPGGDSYTEVLMYEVLFISNMLTGELEPLIGDSYEVNGTDVTVKVNPKVTFSDGSACTVDDVIYSYELGKKYTIQWSQYWQFIDSIERVDNNTIVFHQKAASANTLYVLDSLQGVPILPKKIWEKVEADNGYDITKIRTGFLNMDDPIGTGAYKVYMYNDQRVVLIRNENYWGAIPERFGKLASAKYLINVFYSSNDSLTTAFKNNEVDLAQAFIPNIWDLIKANPAIDTYIPDFPYHLEGAMVSMMYNVTKPGLNNPAVRRALAFAINTKQIGQAAMSGYTKDLDPMLVLTNGAEDRYVDKESLRSLQYTYDPQKANQLLDELGARPGADGIRVLPDGTRMSWAIQSGYGWTDWNATCEVIAQNMKAIGVDIRPEMPEGAVFGNNRATGDFELALTIPGEGIRPSQPWYRYSWIMSDANSAPIGEFASSNQMRYSNARANELVRLIPAETDEAKLRAYHTEINRIFLEELPLVPVMYRPFQFYEVNNTYWTGWPKQGDGTNVPPMHDRLAGLGTFFIIRPVQK
jgi:peptide/nickel transport system substrate-binding protein